MTECCYRCGITLDGWEPYFPNEVAVCVDCEDYLAQRYADKVNDIDDDITVDTPPIFSTRTEDILCRIAVGWCFFITIWTIYKSL